MLGRRSSPGPPAILGRLDLVPDQHQGVRDDCRNQGLVIDDENERATRSGVGHVIDWRWPPSSWAGGCKVKAIRDRLEYKGVAAISRSPPFRKSSLVRWIGTLRSAVWT